MRRSSPSLSSSIRKPICCGGAILDAGAGHDGVDSARRCAPRSGRPALAGLLQRVQAANHPSVRLDRARRSGAGRRSAFWTQLIALHRRVRTLNKELKDAERALGEDPTDANWAWLSDVKGRLSAIDGTEALIEGFGASSGRAVRGV